MKTYYNFLLLLVLSSFSVVSQTTTRPSEDFIERLYVSANFGIINYDYGFNLLKNGNTANSISNTSTFAGRFAVGTHLKKGWDVQLSVMRPAEWVQYENVNGNTYNKSVWTNIWGISARKNLLVFHRFRVFLEAGVSNVMRNGFELNGEEIIKDVQYIYPIFGVGIYYPIGKKIDAVISTTYSPEKSKDNQPATFFISGGITFNVGEQSEEVLRKKKESPYYFPRDLFQVGYVSDEFGFDINKQFSSGLSTSIPVFWLGDVFVKQGIIATYQYDLFHTYKNFSLSAGINYAHYETQKGDQFSAISIYPLIKWWFLRTNPIDVYFNYSLIGPAYISSSRLDGIDTGEEATFQDYLGIGFLFGKNRRYNLDFRIAHYSNGNIFGDNPGVAIPLSINLGYALY
ncbi:acyloxyacyl hydrolase [Zunongwangia sp.]|uniref:acyloxyacyl hydrolase n=1 Tax=Zunongwangia sp. TaxID=1965325 RepID=UPI003AA8818F